MSVQNDEILVKLRQISEQARLTRDELPLRLAKERLDLIIALARYLTTAIGMASGPHAEEQIDRKRAAAQPR